MGQHEPAGRRALHAASCSVSLLFARSMWTWRSFSAASTKSCTDKVRTCQLFLQELCVGAALLWVAALAISFSWLWLREAPDERVYAACLT